MTDRIFAIVVIIIASIFWIESYYIPAVSGGYTLGPSFFPRMLLIALALLSAILLIKSFLPNNTSPSFKGVGDFFKVHWRVPVLLVQFFLYILLLNMIGFVTSSILFMIGAFALLMKSYTPKFVVISFVLAFSLPLSISWLFQNFLRTVLP